MRADAPRQWLRAGLTWAGAGRDARSGALLHVPVLALRLETSGVRGDLRASLHAQLGQQRRDVVLDRLLGQVELLGDLSIRVPLTDQIEDVKVEVNQEEERLKKF